jgi:hypothetical protein
MADAVNAPGAIKGGIGPSGEEPGVIVDNRTALPDSVVLEAVQAQWVETAGLQFGVPSSFQLYATNPNGSMLSRTPFRTPTNVMDEIKLAREVADTDDDIAATIGQCLATAYGDGMQNQHEHEPTNSLFNEIARGMNLDSQLKEMYREYLIAASVTTISLFTRSRLDFIPSGTTDRVRAQLATPLLGILPAENIRVLTNDLFGQGELAYEVTDQKLKEWLDEFFADNTTAARKSQMRDEQPVISAVFTGETEVDWNDQDFFSAGKTLYTLNPRMVHRTTMPKGAQAYPRPPLTANFALLEAKRLLNIMDYSLLQGGTNYIVVAKQGSDKLPAKQPEIDNLVDQVRSASRTGVLVGDHRLDIEIITPKLDELLNPAKRQLVGRKLTMRLLRIPEQVTHDAGGKGAEQELEFTGRTITADRRDIKRHVESTVYSEIVRRNRAVFTRGAPSLWFPKIILTGVKDFFDSVVKARDRGDIPRKWAVEVLGFDYEAGVAQRKRELESGDDEIMVPASVPFSNPAGPSAGPNDGGEGRPPGSSSNNGRPGSPPPVDPAQRQRQLIPRRRGEPIRAVWDEERATTVRVGELTAAVLEEYPGHTVGRVSALEREAVAANELRQSGPVAIVPVNPGYEVTEIRAFRLSDGVSMIVGQRPDGALVARALCFREPDYELDNAVEMAMRWGFITEALTQAEVVEAEVVEPSAAQQLVAAIVDQPELLEKVATAFAKSLSGLVPDITLHIDAAGDPKPEPDET